LILEMSTNEYWIALSGINGLGGVTYKNLISRYSDPPKVFSAASNDLLKVEGITPNIVKLIKEFDDWEPVKEEVEKLKKLKLDLLVLTDPAYPKNLYNIYNPPPYLYIAGKITKDDKRAISIVGSRIPDVYGKKVTEQIAAELARNGITVVSGLARGIDSIAHRACLKAPWQFWVPGLILFIRLKTKACIKKYLKMGPYFQSLKSVLNQKLATFPGETES